MQRFQLFEDFKPNSKKLLVLEMTASKVTSLGAIIKNQGIPVFKKKWVDEDLEDFLSKHKKDIAGIVISGSHASPLDFGSPVVPESFIQCGLPILGICYGFEYLVLKLGGKLEEMKREERITTLAKLEKSPLFEGMDLKQEYPVEMAHDVMVKKLPKGYEIIASANETPIAGMQHKELGIYGIQFHPERNWLAPIVFKNFYNLG